MTAGGKGGGGPGGCVIWMEATDKYGYGVMLISWTKEGKKLEKVHRVALKVQMYLTRSQFPGGGLEVNYLCHKKLCVNPVHLVLEAHATNLESLHCRNQGFCCGLHCPIVFSNQIILFYNKEFLYLFVLEKLCLVFFPWAQHSFNDTFIFY